MRPTIEQLRNPDQYTLVESFRIDEINAFVQRELGLPTRNRKAERPLNRWFATAVLLVMAVGGGVVGYTLASTLKQGGGKDQLGGLITQIGTGVVGFFALLPIHEVIHGLSFQRTGADRVKYGGSLTKLMVYAYAQYFVMTLRELALVAIMPFLLITSALSLAWLVWPAYGVVWGTVLLLHTLGCFGDFALIRYYYKNRRRTMYTYDDVEGERRSYFFEVNTGRE